MSDPLSITAGVIAIVDATSKLLKYFNDVREAPKQRADCEIELSELYSLLISVKYRLDVSDPTVTWYKAVRTLGIENGPLAQYRIALDSWHKKISKHNRVTAVLKWKFTKDDVEVLRARIERLKSTIQIILQSDQFELSKATKDDTEGIKKGTEELIVATRKIEDHARSTRFDAKLQDALNWISPTNYPARQCEFLRRRYPGTCTWFLNTPELKRWRQEVGGTLLCTGMPGAGKTIMAATVIDELSHDLNLERNGLAYVFCNYKDQSSATALDPLAAVLKQLVQHKPSAAGPLLQIHRQNEKQKTYPSPKEISEALRLVLEEFTVTHVVIDALDEYSDQSSIRNRLLKRLHGLQRQADVRLLLTSRPVPEILESMGNTARVEIRANENDVKAFAVEVVGNLPRTARGDLQFVEWVISTIVEAVDGMYVHGNNFESV